MPGPYDKITDEFRNIQPRCSRLYAEILNSIGLSQPQFAVLIELRHAGKPVTMTEISRKLFITKPAVTNLADRLEKNGFLKRLKHPSDRRVFLLEIQPKGKRTVERAHGKFLDVLLCTVKQFNGKERAVIERFYAELSGAMDVSLSGKKRG